MSIDPLVTAEWLHEHLNDPGIRVVDMRGSVVTRRIEPGVEEATYLGARQEYRAGHVPGAVYLDWTQDIVDLNDPVPAQIAPPERFAEVMSASGIGNNTHVVVYDHKGGQFATRLWWALRYYGHDLVSVVDGGWNRWCEEDFPVEAGDVKPPRADFTAVPNPSLRITAEALLGRIDDPDVVIIDARDIDQFTAAKRRGPRGGHIPKARHVPRELFFDDEGGFRPLAEIGSLIASRGLDPNARIIAYCNGGVAATVPLFNLHRLGFKNLTNYDGSWNEWGPRTDLPIEP